MVTLLHYEEPSWVSDLGSWESDVRRAVAVPRPSRPPKLPTVRRTPRGCNVLAYTSLFAYPVPP